jgi:hypothetical protein
MTANTPGEFHTIGDVAVELVRRDSPRSPRPHWVVRTVENDYTFEAGCFPHNKTRKALLEELEYAFQRAGSNTEFRRRMSLPEQAPEQKQAAG